MNKVTLRYFKPSGKYYAEGTLETSINIVYQIFDEVRRMQCEGQLPGLLPGSGMGYSIYVDCSEMQNGYPAMIPPIKLDDGSCLLKWIEVSSSVPVIPKGESGAGRKLLGRSVEHGAMAVSYVRGYINPNAGFIIEGSSDQCFWVNRDVLYSKLVVLHDIVDWADMPA